MTQKQTLILMLLALPWMSVAAAQEAVHMELYSVPEPAKLEVQDLPPAEFSAEKAKQEAEAKAAEQAKQEAEAKAKAEAEAKAAEQARQEAEAKAAEQARQEAEAKAKAEAEAKAAEQAKQEAEAKAAEQARQEAEAKAKAEAEANAAEQAKQEAEAKAAEQARQEAEAKAKAEAEAKAAEQARQEAEAKAAEQAKQEAEAKAKADAEAKAAEQAKQEVEAKAEEVSKDQAKNIALTDVQADAAVKAQSVEPITAQTGTEALTTTNAQTVESVVAPAGSVESAIPKVQAVEPIAAPAGAVESATTTTQVVEPVTPPIQSVEPTTAPTGTVESAAPKIQAVEPIAAPTGTMGSATTTTQALEPTAAPAGLVESTTPKVQAAEPIATPTGTADTAKAQAVEPVTQPTDQAKLEDETKAAEKSRLEAIAKSKKLLAEKNNVLLDTVQKAVLKNPDVLSRWENFKAAVKETDAARGGYFPQLDISSGQGREKYLATPAAATLMDRRGYTVTLKQMLYDGFATRNEVRRLTNAQLARYYELLDASESAALEALRAYYDVARNRKLFELTEDNYVLTRTVLEQISQKVKAGVGRRVDLEQSAGRLALSQSNLVMDNANIHDVNARYQRVVGELPPERLENSSSRAMYKAMAKEVLPNAAGAILSVGVEYHPAILAAVENVRSAKYDMYERWGKFSPTVNLNLSQTNNINYTGISGLTSDTVAEVTLSWNIFNGGTDRARSGQYARKLEAARDQRDKTCRDVRMTLAIAYNDISKITDQLEFLDQHQLAIEKARAAYQKQFEIGQRTLLDVLDSENELYQARRSYTNAEFDLKIAYVRTLAGMGKLVSTLGVPTLEATDLPELLGTSSEGPENCPPEPPLSANIPYEELNARAIEAAKPTEPPPNLDAPMAASGVPGIPAVPAPGSQADLDAKAAVDVKAAAEAEQFMLNPNEIKARKKAKAEKPAAKN